jgi:transcriptional regulator GlxA family with amidase domain
MSTVPAVKAALVALFAGNLPGAQVLYGPRGPLVGPSIVEVGDVSGTVEQASLNAARVTERYVVEVIVSCTIDGPDVQQDATEAALALYGSAEVLVRSTDLGVPGVVAHSTGEFELAETAMAAGRNAAIRWGVAVHANSN